MMNNGQKIEKYKNKTKLLLHLQIIEKILNFMKSDS